MQIKITAPKAAALAKLGFQIYVEFYPTEEQLAELAEDPSVSGLVALARSGDEGALERCARIILDAL